MAVDADLVDRVRVRLAATGAAPTPAAVAAALRSVSGVSGDTQITAVLDRLRAELAGAGPLEPLLRDPAVTDILVNAPDEVWAERSGELVRLPLRFPGEDSVRRLAQRLAATAGRRLDDASPYVDARLVDGTRLHAVLPPVAPAGTCLSLRIPRRSAFSLPELVAAGSLSAAGAVLLHLVIRRRLAFVVSGGTGTGKTTLLSALLGQVDPAERVVLVEDAGELRPTAPHVVRLEARAANVEGAGEVSLRDLVRQALRMRPDRLVVGEVRGAEVVDLLAAMNTGHEGGCGTVHANSARDVPARMEALAGLAGMTRAALHSQLASAVDVVLHLTRDPGGARRLAEVSVLRPDRDGLVRVDPALIMTRAGPQPAAGAGILADLLLARGADADDLVAAGLSSPGPATAAAGCPPAAGPP